MEKDDLNFDKNGKPLPPNRTIRPERPLRKRQSTASKTFAPKKPAEDTPALKVRSKAKEKFERQKPTPGVFKNQGSAWEQNEKIIDLLEKILEKIS